MFTVLSKTIFNINRRGIYTATSIRCQLIFFMFIYLQKKPPFANVGFSFNRL